MFTFTKLIIQYESFTFLKYKFWVLYTTLQTSVEIYQTKCLSEVGYEPPSLSGHVWGSPSGYFWGSKAGGLYCSLSREAVCTLTWWSSSSAGCPWVSIISLSTWYSLALPCVDQVPYNKRCRGNMASLKGLPNITSGALHKRDNNYAVPKSTNFTWPTESMILLWLRSTWPIVSWWIVSLICDRGRLFWQFTWM